MNYFQNNTVLACFLEKSTILNILDNKWKSFIGIGGEKCDECAVGHVQNIPISPDHPVQTRFIPLGAQPNCVKCGECFDNWQRILNG